MKGDYTGLPQTSRFFCGMALLYCAVVLKKRTEFGLLALGLITVTLIYEELRMNVAALLIK